ncbi:MAG TPA: phospholipase [Sneathiellales bacterium]|nr:phospholipase [Sneathiellales bacterium]
MSATTDEEIPKLSGPRVEPQSGAAPEHLIVLVHGYGADGNDLIGLAGPWAQAMPNVAFVAPNGPEPCAMSPFGRQWFPLTNQGAEERREGVRQAAPVLNKFIAQELDRYGLPETKLALVGFSQGTMLSLHVGLRRAHSPAAIVGFSGMLTGTGYLADEVTVKPPVLLIHGSDDEVIPVSALDHACTALEGVGIKVKTHVSDGIRHGVAPDGMELGAAFLRDAFASASNAK